MVLLLAAAAVLGGVVLLALGRGGEMTSFPPDCAPPPDLVTATDVALLQPPRALWGYSTQFTEEALERIARALTERDIEIERLRAQVGQLRAGTPALSEEPGRDA